MRVIPTAAPGKTKSWPTALTYLTNRHKLQPKLAHKSQKKMKTIKTTKGS